MTSAGSAEQRLHEDHDLFLAAVNFTAVETAFAPRLIERDYFCTLLLDYLAATSDTLVFKGGTCLAKVHAVFYRLSEDLDFAVPMASTARREERSAHAAPIRDALRALPARRPVFRTLEPLTGADSSRQYLAAIGYDSVLTRQEDVIRIEIALREPMLTPMITGAARTILLDPISGGSILGPTMLKCISKIEAYAEKFRAALTRREAAIRDFYDIDYATRTLEVDIASDELLLLVRQKLEVPGTDPVDTSAARVEALRRQVEAQLKPVLRERDLAEFDLGRAFRTVQAMARRVAEYGPTLQRPDA